MKLTVILEPEADGGYSVICPALPGCVSQGDNLQEALDNIVEAIEMFLDYRNESHMPAPIETPEIIAHEIEACLKDREAEGLPLTIETRQVVLPAKAAA